MTPFAERCPAEGQAEIRTNTYRSIRWPAGSQSELAVNCGDEAYSSGERVTIHQARLVPPSAYVFGSWKPPGAKNDLLFLFRDNV